MFIGRVADLGQSVESREASERDGRVNQCDGRSPIRENRMIDKADSPPRRFAVDLKGQRILCSATP